MVADTPLVEEVEIITDPCIRPGFVAWCDASQHAFAYTKIKNGDHAFEARQRAHYAIVHPDHLEGLVDAFANGEFNP